MIKLAADDGTMIDLLKYISHSHEVPHDPQICDIGCSHIAFTVDDIDKEYRRLSDKGVRFNSPPLVSSDRYGKVAFCRDPDGVFIELVEILH